MHSRDVFDPQTIGDVARRVDTVERLKALTLLTYADISAVNPHVMTEWRADQLWQLYLMVYNELTRTLESDRIEAIPPARRSVSNSCAASPPATCGPTLMPRSRSTCSSTNSGGSAVLPWNSAAWNRPGR